jgi:uncharacterized membrane protein YkoI
LLNDSEYTLQRNIFKGTDIWEFKTNFKNQYDGFVFIYRIDANTGEIISKSEPRMDGFGAKR